MEAGDLGLDLLIKHGLETGDLGLDFLSNRGLESGGQLLGDPRFNARDFGRGAGGRGGGLGWAAQRACLSQLNLLVHGFFADACGRHGCGRSASLYGINHIP